MPRGKATTTSSDHTTLQMALIGYELEKERITAKIKEIQAQLGGSKSTGTAAVAKSEGEPKKRVLSAAARKRIAAAQKKRWAEHRKKVAASKA